MKCKTSDSSCPYHACMSNECMKEEAKANGADWGAGFCSGKSLNEAYAEWLFSPDGYRKAEPRGELSHILNRMEGIARRKKTKLPRKLKKKRKKEQAKAFRHIYLVNVDDVVYIENDIKLKPGCKLHKMGVFELSTDNETEQTYSSCPSRSGCQDPDTEASDN